MIRPSLYIVFDSNNPVPFKQWNIPIQQRIVRLLFISKQVSKPGQADMCWVRLTVSCLLQSVTDQKYIPWLQGEWTELLSKRIIAFHLQTVPKGSICDGVGLHWCTWHHGFVKAPLCVTSNSRCQEDNAFVSSFGRLAYFSPTEPDCAHIRAAGLKQTLKE